jgi:hypothetical protein
MRLIVEVISKRIDSMKFHVSYVYSNARSSTENNLILHRVQSFLFIV